MNWIDRIRGREERSSPENPTVPVSAANFLQFFGIQAGPLETPTTDKALTVPAVASAVAFLSRSMANLPLHAYRDLGGDRGSEKVGGSLQRMLNEAPNPQWTSFGMRQYFWQQVFTEGRGLAWIERAARDATYLWPLDATKTTVRRDGMRKVYTYNGKDYDGADVIDVPFMLKSDQLSVRSPLVLGGGTIAVALAMRDYSGGFFAGGGVPPLALEGPMPAGADALKRAQADVKRSIDGAKKRGEAIMPIPAGYTLKPIGFDPDKGQMTDAMRFIVEEIARLFNLPPVFLQDLTRGTFSNTEQQDLQLVKHLISHWAKALEEELNLKLFGPTSNRRYCEHNLDGLMRGDFKTRMEGLALGVNSALLTPEEARALDNRPTKPGADKLYIQGATVPIGSQPQEGAQPPADEGGVA
jgi:HK97 family phage portal protein